MRAALVVLVIPGILLQEHIIVPKTIFGRCPGSGRVFPFRFRRESVQIMTLTPIELADEFLRHLPRHPFDWSIGVTFEMTGIGAHDFLPLGLRDFILAQIKWLTDDDLTDRLLVRVTFL